MYYIFLLQQMIQFILENRKIKSPLLEETESALSMRANKKLVQTKLHSEGSHASLKDLHNIAAKLSTKNGDDLQAAVKLLTESYGNFLI